MCYDLLRCTLLCLIVCLFGCVSVVFVCVWLIALLFVWRCACLCGSFVWWLRRAFVCLCNLGCLLACWCGCLIAYLVD